MLKSRQFIIGIVISIVFLVWALSNENLGAVGSAILKANFLALLPALVLYFIGVWLRAVRWRILLNPIASKISTYKTFEVVVIGYMANDVLPARIGELVRAYVLSRREGVRKTATLATIVVERIFDGLILVGFAATVVFYVTIVNPGLLSTGSGHNLGNLLTNQSGVIGIAAFAFLVALVVFIFVASSRTRVQGVLRLGLRLVPGRLHGRVEALADSFIDGLGSLRSASGMAAVFGLSILAWLFESSMYYVVGTWGFNLTSGGAPLPFYAYMLATSFANLSTLIPQAPGFVGVFDAIAKIVLVGAFGVDSNQAISYVLLLHAALLVPVTLLGFFYLAKESLSWRDLTHLEESRAEASAQAHELEGPFTDYELVQEGKLSEGEPDVPDVPDVGNPDGPEGGGSLDGEEDTPTAALVDEPTRAADARPTSPREKV